MFLNTGARRLLWGTYSGTAGLAVLIWIKHARGARPRGRESAANYAAGARNRSMTVANRAGWS